MRLKDVPRVHQVPGVVVNLLHDLKLELVRVTFLRQPYCPHRQRGLKSNSEKTGESTKWFSIKLRCKFWALTLRTTQRAKTRYRTPWMVNISCERARLSSLPSPCLWRCSPWFPCKGCKTVHNYGQWCFFFNGIVRCLTSLHLDKILVALWIRLQNIRTLEYQYIRQQNESRLNAALVSQVVV